MDTASDGIEGSEQSILDEDVGTGKGSHQSAFASVSVADEGDDGHTLAGALTSVQRALTTDLFDLTFQSADLVADEAAVGLQLGLARATSTDAALQPFQVGPLAAEAGEDVFVLSELDLEPALAGAGMLGEDVQNEGCTIEDLDLQGLLQVTLLGGAEFVVEDDGGKREFVTTGGDLLDFALTDVGGRMGAVEPLNGAANDGGARRAGQEG